MEALLKEIRACIVCKDFLPNPPNPIVQLHQNARICIIGQAPGRKVDALGIPWMDASGKRLREWLQVTDEEFYNPEIFALLPMGFCYPGTGKSGDLPPRKECAPLWHDRVFAAMPNISLIILIGTYAQKAYLKENYSSSLTENVYRFESFLPKFLPLPHPSPRNRNWFSKNDWFEHRLLTILQAEVGEILGKKIA